MASSTGAVRTGPTSSGSETRSVRHTVAGLPRCWTHSQAAARSPWKRCVWAAKSPQWTSIPWLGFILKCTLEYPQKLAGQTLPLPEFVLEDRDFMEAFFKAKGYKGVALRTLLERFGHADKTQLDLVQTRRSTPRSRSRLACAGLGQMGAGQFSA